MADIPTDKEIAEKARTLITTDLAYVYSLAEKATNEKVVSGMRTQKK